jgi:hypothetical protein
MVKVLQGISMDSPVKKLAGMADRVNTRRVRAAQHVVCALAYP